MRNGHFGKPVWGMKAQWKCGHRHNESLNRDHRS
jgi:hypothetical protein